MANSYWEVQNNPKVHEGDIELDVNIIAQLPPRAIIKSCRGHGASNWNTTARIDIEVEGNPSSYFLKLASGPQAGSMFLGEYESMKLINQRIPSFSPKPLGLGKCRDSDRYFVLLSFHALHKGNPSIPRFTQALAQLHSPNEDPKYANRFGFHTTTYNGTLGQANGWSDSWEEFYIKGMRHMLELERASAGPSDELAELEDPFLNKVIPRLLRPMETNGKRVTPVLLHGDLWLGNVSIQDGSDDPLMFDASAFWGHNEYELAGMRLVEDDWATECVEAYHKLLPKSEPVEDWDDRNALYSIRVIIHDAALYPKSTHFRQLLITEMRKLVEKFPEGFVEN